MSGDLSDNPQVQAVVARARERMDVLIAEAPAYARWRDEKIASITDKAMREQVERSMSSVFGSRRK